MERIIGSCLEPANYGKNLVLDKFTPEMQIANFFIPVLLDIPNCFGRD